MKHAVTRELFAYWSRLRGERLAPERNDIDPVAIRAILSDTFILEVDHDAPRPGYPFRLSGTRLNALFLDELKNRPMRDLWDPSEQPGLIDVLSSVVGDCAPVVAGLRAGPEGHRPIDFEMILLPLRHRGRTHARILGAIAPIEVPSWLGLLKIGTFSMTALRLIGSLDGEGTGSLSRVVPDDFIPPRRYGPFVLHQGGR